MIRRRSQLWLAAAALGVSSTLAASTYFPISDDVLRSRSDVVVVVRAGQSRVVASPEHVAETITRCDVERAAAGSPSAEIEIAIPGGVLPDGRGSYLWMPDLTAGHRYVLFLKTRADGRYCLSEGALGVFEVDDTGTAARRPAFTAGPMSRIRPLSALIGTPAAAKPGAKDPGSTLAPQWGNFNPPNKDPILARWTGGANVNVGFVDDDLADAPHAAKGVPGGGVPQIQSAVDAFTNDPSSNINYHFVGEQSATVTIHLDNVSEFNGVGFPCETGIQGELGIAEIDFSGSHDFKGTGYDTITKATVWLARWDCDMSAFLTSAFENQMLHELGHTLGLGHPDQVTSRHDFTPNDYEPTPTDPGAVMLSLLDFERSVGLGSDDYEGLCYLYGACDPTGPPAAGRVAARIAERQIRTVHGR